MIATAVRLLIWFTILTGFVYPVAVTAIGRALFAGRAAGSLISMDGKPVGSELLAQKFTNAKYFRARPSAGDIPYATVPSAASNAGPTSEALKKAVEEQGIDYVTLKRMARNSLTYSFADPATKKRLHVVREPSWRIVAKA